MLRSHIDHCVWSRVYDLQRGTIDTGGSESDRRGKGTMIEEMAMAIIQIGEYVQTVCRQAATVVFPEDVEIVIASWWECAATE